VKSGLYALWLKLPPSWRSESVTEASERSIQELQEEAKIASRRRAGKMGTYHWGFSRPVDGLDSDLMCSLPPGVSDA
jgi:hypothetical protein